MKEQITKLISVKSIVTLLLTAVFSYLSVVGRMTSEDFKLVFVMIMTYYFSKKDKPEGGNDERI